MRSRKHTTIRYLLGYTSSLYELALEAQKLGRTDLRMAVVLTNAEPVFGYQREALEKAFQCPVRATYGMAEIAAAASECEARQMHLWPEASWLEVLEEGEAAGDRAGDLVSTTLLNSDMPLIRYRVGDRVRLSTEPGACACGRRLPRIAEIEGRSDDLLYTADGRRIGRLDPVFKANLPIREAQIIQEALDRIRVLYVPAGEFDDAAGRYVELAELCEKHGDLSGTRFGYHNAAGMLQRVGLLLEADDDHVRAADAPNFCRKGAEPAAF